MTPRIEIQASEGTRKEFVAKVQSWANEVLEKKGPLVGPAVISINIWRRLAENTIDSDGTNFMGVSQQLIAWCAVYGAYFAGIAMEHSRIRILR